VVLILGGDWVVGRALRLLLRDAEYRVRFLIGPSLDQPGLLDGVQLLLLAPGLGAEFRDALLALVGRRPLAVRIPILELVDNPRSAGDGAAHTVPWPCRAEELKREIKALLLTKPGADRDGRAAQTPQEERGLVDDRDGR
jgi:hypothetical protein